MDDRYQPPLAPVGPPDEPVDVARRKRRKHRIGLCVMLVGICTLCYGCSAAFWFDPKLDFGGMVPKSKGLFDERLWLSFGVFRNAPGWGVLWGLPLVAAVLAALRCAHVRWVKPVAVTALLLWLLMGAMLTTLRIT